MLSLKTLLVWGGKIALAGLLLYILVPAFALGFYVSFADTYRLIGLVCFICASVAILIRIFVPWRFLKFIVLIGVVCGGLIITYADALRLKKQCHHFQSCEQTQNGSICGSDRIMTYISPTQIIEECEAKGYWNKDE